MIAAGPTTIPGIIIKSRGGKIIEQPANPIAKKNVSEARPASSSLEISLYSAITFHSQSTGPGGALEVMTMAYQTLLGGGVGDIVLWQDLTATV